MDLAAQRERLTSAYRTRRDQALGLVERIPILGRLVNDFVRIEFIDRCMLIAAQGLLALVPMLVVLRVFLPDATGAALDSFANATGVGHSGTRLIEGEVTASSVRAQTGVIGLVVTIFSASSFARAIQRMYERVWETPHVGGISGAQRCLVWLIGWMATLQLVGGVRTLMTGIHGLLGDGLSFVVQGLLFALIWWVTGWLLLFGRVPWRSLALGALLTRYVGVLYTRASSVVMPPYVRANADQFGTLGIVLAISTWLIGFAAIMVGAALIGRIVSEDPTVHRLVSRSAAYLPERRRPPQQSAPEAGTAAPPPGG